MAQPFWDKRGNLHPTYAAARVADAAFDAAEEAKKHTKLLENQNAAVSEQARTQAKAQKRQNELAEEALELERECAAEEAEHRGRLERIESDRLQSEKDHTRFQRDVMVLESATDEERLEFFVNMEREDLPSFWDSISLSYLLHKFRQNPELGSKYRQLFGEMRQKAKEVAEILKEHRSLDNRTNSGTRRVGLLVLLWKIWWFGGLTYILIRSSLLGWEPENRWDEPSEPWGVGYYLVLQSLIVAWGWYSVKNSDSVQNLIRFGKHKDELRAFNETHGDTLKIQMDFEKFARENVEARKDLLIGVLAEVNREHSAEQKEAIAEAVRSILKDRTKDYPRRCRPSDACLNDAEGLFAFFRNGWPKSDLVTLECGVAHQHSASPGVLERLEESPGFSMSDYRKSLVQFVNIGHEPKAAENFLKNAGYAAE